MEPTLSPVSGRRDREAAIGRMATALGHESVNLLAVLAAWIDLGRAKTPAGHDPGNAMTLAKAALERLQALTCAMHLAASGTLASVSRDFTLTELVTLSHELAAPKLRTAGVALRWEPAAVAPRLKGNLGQWVMALSLVLRRAAELGASPLTLRQGTAGGAATLELNASGAWPDRDDPDLTLAAALATELGGTLRLPAPPSTELACLGIPCNAS